MGTLIAVRVEKELQGCQIRPCMRKGVPDRMRYVVGGTCSLSWAEADLRAACSSTSRV